MNKKIQLIIVSAMIFLSAAVIFGQEKPIGKSAFLMQTDAGRKNLNGKTYRSTRTEEKFADRNSAAMMVSKNIYETIPPDKYHVTDEAGGKKTEKIVIGTARYLRINDGAWKREMSGGAGNGNGSGVDIESETYKLTENVELNGQNVNFYEQIEKLSDLSGRDEKKFWTKRFWLTKEGLLIKTEDERESTGTNAFTRDTTVYEYDSKIKIVAPIK